MQSVAITGEDGADCTYPRGWCNLCRYGSQGTARGSRMQNREMESENPYAIVTEMITLNRAIMILVKKILTNAISHCIIQVRKRDPY